MNPERMIPGADDCLAGQKKEECGCGLRIVKINIIY